MQDLSSTPSNLIEISDPSARLTIADPKSGSYPVSPEVTNISLGFDKSMVVKSSRVGDTMVLTLSNGEVIQLVGYYAATVAPAAFFFVPQMLLATWALADDDSDGLTEVASVTSTDTMNGLMVVNGIAPNSAAVEVVFPDGHSVMTTASSDDGEFQAISERPQGSGRVYINVMEDDRDTDTELVHVFVNDNVPPDAPDIDNALVEPNGTVTVTGSAEIGSIVSVVFPDGSVVEDVADATGAYSVTSDTSQGNGTILATARDGSGNVSDPSAVFNFVSGMAPLTVGSSDGSTVVGTGEVGASVAVTNASGALIGTATVAPDGSWNAALSPLPADGSTISAVQTYISGGTFGPVSEIVDYVPGAPAVPGVGTSDGMSASGTGEPGAVVEITDNTGSVIGTTTVAPDGSWSTLLSPNATGGSTISVSQTDPAGNESGPATQVISGADITPPAAPFVNPSDGATASGTGEVGATVEVANGSGTVIGTTTVQPDGSWSTPLSPVPADGTTISTTQSDPSGNQSPSTNETVDYTPGTPAAPVLDPTNGNTATGTGESGAVVEVTNPSDTLIGTATVQPNGSWNTALSPIPSDGESISAVQTDPAGNESPPSTQTVDVALADTLAAPVLAPSDGTAASGTGEPGATVTVDNSSGAAIGTAIVQPDGSWNTALLPVPSDGSQISANQMTPGGQESDYDTQTVDYTPGAPNAPTLDPSNGQWAAGSGEVGAAVTIADDNGNSIGTAIVAADGSWIAVLSPVPTDGSTIQALQTDSAGNQSLPTTQTVDYLPGSPSEPTINPSDGSSAFGIGESGAMVSVTDASNAEIGSAMVQPDGTWSTTLTPIPADGAVITATQTDPAGNESDPANQTVNSAALLPPTLDPSVGPSATGTGEPGAVVAVTDENGDPIGTATVQPDGSWSTTLSPMPNDGSTITAVQTDPGGNASAPATQTIDYIAGAPGLPGLDPTDGSSATGTGEPGATVEITDASNAVIGTATVFPDGSWSTPLSPTPSDGSDISATQTDRAGNESLPVIETVDYASGAPSAPTINPSDGSFAYGTGEPGSIVTVTDDSNTTIGSAVVQPDGSWISLLSPTPNDGSDIDVFQTDAAGNDSPPASVIIDYILGAPAAPSLDPSDGNTASGTGEPGATVAVTDAGGTPIGSATVQPDGSWSTALSPVPADGSAISTSQTDPAGNQGPPASVTVDYAAATLPTPGLNPTDGSTASGSGEPGATVEVRDASNAVIGTATVQPDGSWTMPLAPTPADGSNVTAVQTAIGFNDSAPATTPVDYTPGVPSTPAISPTDGTTASGTGEPGATVEITNASAAVIGTATVQPDGSWTTPLAPTPADGSEIEATQTDPAGNESSPASETVDYTPGAPTAPILDPSVGPSATGTGEPGAVVAVTDENGDPIGTATVQPDGSWSTTLSPMPNDGSTITAVQTDPGGNASAPATQSVSNGFGSAGSPSQINTDTDGYQSPPKTLVLDDGRVLHIWGNDGSTSYNLDMVLQGRIYNANGSAATSQFSLDSLWAFENLPHFDWDSLDVDLLQNGNVLISYARNLSEPGDIEPVFSIIDPSVVPGNPGFIVTANVEIQSNDTTTYESPPVATVLDNGNVLFVWSKNGISDNNSMAVQARLFDQNGVSIGTEYSIGSYAIDGYNSYDVDNMTVTQLSGGNIVVSYVRQTYEPGYDEPIFSILNSSGTVLVSDTEIQQNDTTTYESPAAITAMADGRWAAIWLKNGASDDSTSIKLQGRIMEADGTPSTDEFQVGNLAVDGYDGYDMDNFGITELSDGKLVAGFVRATFEAGGDRPMFSIIDPNFAPNQTGFEVASDVLISQTAATTYAGPPVIEAVGNGNFVAVWGDGWYADQGINYRIYNSSGTPLTDQIMVVGETNQALDSFDNFGWDNLDVDYNASNHSFVISWVSSSDGNYTGVTGSGPIPAPGLAPPVAAAGPSFASAPDMANVAALELADVDTQLSFVGIDERDVPEVADANLELSVDDRVDLASIDLELAGEVGLGQEAKLEGGENVVSEGVDRPDMSITAAVLEELNTDLAMLAANDQIAT